MLPHRSILFVLSDFLIPGAGQRDEGGGTGAAGSDPAGSDPGGSAEAGAQDDPFTAFSRTLKLVSNRHDVVAIRLVDAIEETLPDAGLLVLTDPETGREVAVDTGRARVRGRYDARAGAADQAVRSLFRRLAVDEIEVRTDRSYVGPLMQFFRARVRRAR